MFVQCAGLHGSCSDPSGRSPSGSNSVRPRPRRSTWYPSTFIATVAEFAVLALSTYKFKFGPSVFAHLLRPLLTSLSTSLRLSTSVARVGHRQGSPQVSHMRFPSYLLDLRRFFPYRYWVSRIWPVLPESAPLIQFLFVRLMICCRLPSSVRYLSDSAELLVLPPIGRTVDFHHINTRALLGAPKKQEPCQIFFLSDRALEVSRYLDSRFTAEFGFIAQGEISSARNANST